MERDGPVRRASVRIPARLRVEYKTLDDLIVAFSMDLCRGGLFLETATPLPVGTTVGLTLQLPDTNSELHIEARVIHVRSSSLGGRPVTPGMGLQFVNLNPAVLSQIEMFIAERMHSVDSGEHMSSRAALNVLVVEDDPAYQEQASRPFLTREDKVRIASDGFQALAMAMQEQPDVIVCDVNLPRMDGWQLLRLMRARPQLASIPVIFTTALSGESERLKGYTLGVDDYLPKPYRPIELRTRVDRLVARHKTRVAEKTSSGGHTLRGDLAQVSLASVLAFFEMERRSGELLVDGAVKGVLFMRDGQLINARTERPQKLEALDATWVILDSKEGEFEFRTHTVDGEDRIGMPTSHVLMEHARRSDEKGR